MGRVSPALDALPTIEVGDERSDAPLVFMLSGFPDDHSVYARLAEDLKDDYRVVIACMPLHNQQSLEKGQGKSRDPTKREERAHFNSSPPRHAACCLLQLPRPRGHT